MPPYHMHNFYLSIANGSFFFFFEFFFLLYECLGEALSSVLNVIIYSSNPYDSKSCNIVDSHFSVYGKDFH